ncbi:MAG: response regulator [Verrucomicrobia bacterium]|nr:response regulator [Verrucomicrobiota bacterium]
MPADQTIRMLLVEDNPTDAFLLNAALSKASDWKFELVIVQRLQEAGAAFEEHSLDGVITDLNLPDSVGLDTVRELVKLADGLPILALTGWEDPIFGARLIEEGATSYWSKDRIRGPDFPNAIAALIRQKAKEQ